VFNVVASSPTWGLSGVNTFTVNLMRGLSAAGVPCRIVLTEADRLTDRYAMPLPTDILIEKLPASRWASWHTRWQAMIDYLEALGPCIYLPNYDYSYSCISPALSTHVSIIGIVHSDDPQHYEHVARLGKYWNAIVAVSQAVAERTIALNPLLADKVTTIRYGVEAPSCLPKRQSGSDLPIRVVYTGRLVQQQKRVLDLPRIIAALAEQQVPVELTIVGDGAERWRLGEMCSELGVSDSVQFFGMLSNRQVLRVLEQSDVFILPSEFEGLPVSLLEAMARGCIPVVADICSGVPELVQDGINGYRLPVGNIRGFAERLALLQRDPELRQELASRAHHTVWTGGFRLDDMAQSYLALFERVREQVRTGFYCRPPGPITPPAPQTWKDRLPVPVRALGRYVWDSLTKRNEDAHPGFRDGRL
jgi:glycosyltransferase involved in cell wall biosynthesis